VVGMRKKVKESVDEFIKNVILMRRLKKKRIKN